MTSISTSQFAMQSPRAMMDARIGAATQAGTISTEDQTALEKALDSIDSALGVSGGAKPTSRLDPSEMKSRIDGLIQDQVSSGALTADQATELKDFFAQGPGGVEGGKGGMGGMPPMGPPPGCSGGDSSDDSSSDSSETSSTTDQIDSLIAFLEKLRESLASSNGYGTSTSATDSTSSGLVVDQLG